MLLLVLFVSSACVNGADLKKARMIIKNMKECDAQEAAKDAINYIENVKKTKNVDVASDRFFGPETILDGGMTPGDTYMGPALETVVNFLQLGKVTHEFENSLFGAATCTFCKAAFLFLQYYLDKKADYLEVISDTKMLCGGLVFLSSHVCHGLVDSFGRDVFMVMKSTKQSPENICGFMFGEACNNPENPKHEWKPSIPPASVKNKVIQKKPIPSSRSKRHDELLTILHISDTHWDPFYKEGSLAACDDFLCCREESGQVYDEADAAGYWGDSRKCDTPLRTIEAMYRHIRNQHPYIDFIYWTGDLPAHDIWKQTKASNAEIVRGTASQLVEHFPDVPVYPALGNHESVPVDSFPPPTVTMESVSMSWLHDVLDQEWGHWLGHSHSWSVKKGAYYSLNVSPGLRVISLNMNYCMNKNLWLLLNSTDPADQLQWLVYELQLAEFKGEKVHILGHIPPGHVDCVRVWSRNFNKIINRYADTVMGQFFGHTHVDEFQLFYHEDGSPSNVAYIAPSVTPYHSLNPSYRLYTVSVAGEVLDHQTFVMDLEVANNHPEKDPEFYLLYSAKSEYKMPDLSPTSWHNLVNKLQSNKTFFDIFYKNYNSGSTETPCDPVCRRRLICRLVSSRSHDMKKLCGHIHISNDDQEDDNDEGAWWWLG